MRLIAKFPEPPEILDYQVPVAVKDLHRLVNKEWDLAIQRVRTQHSLRSIDCTHFVFSFELLSPLPFIDSSQFDIVCLDSTLCRWCKLCEENCVGC